MKPFTIITLTFLISVYTLIETAKARKASGERIEHRLRFISTANKTVECINSTGKLLRQIVKSGQQMADLESSCSTEALLTKEDHLKCLKRTTKVFFDVKRLASDVSSHSCGLTSPDTTELIPQIDILLQKMENELRISREKFRVFILNDFIAYREMVVKNATMRSKVFNCKMDISNTYSQIIVWSSKITTYYFIGDLFSLKNGFSILEGLHEKIKTTAQVCKMQEATYLKDAAERISKYQKQYKALDYVQATEKACGILRRKSNNLNLVNELCEKPVDSESFQYSLSSLLQKALKYGDER